MRIRAAVILSVPAILAASMAIAAPKATELALESYRLPNGLKVALHRDPTVPRTRPRGDKLT